MNNQVKKDDIEDSQEKSKSPSFITKIKKYIHRQFKIDRFRFVMISFMLILALSAIVISSKNYFLEKAQYAGLIANAKSLTWKEYIDTLKDKSASVKEIQSNYYRTAFTPLGSGDVFVFNEVIFNDGKRAYYKGNLDDEKSKVVQELLLTKNLKENKLAVDHSEKESTLGRMFNSMFMLIGLITLLLMAQRAFADILVGKDFELTRNSDEITFDDIIGYDEVKREFQETVVKMKNWDKFVEKGINPPKGMLLTGPPGVGKTLFAKALANECGASFLYATGADFVELYVGTGARRVRSLFNNARYMAPCVIFIDEIDALGKRDGYGMDSERLSTINQMLAEMDGLNENKAILVVAATNHQSKVDTALLRPGRFDKKIDVPEPDEDTRKGILEFYAKRFENNIDFKRYAKITSGMSGADLKNLIEEAKNLKLREIGSPDEKLFLSNKEMDEAIEVILLGVSPNKSHESEIHRVSVHELGHAIVGYVMGNNSHVQKVSVAGRGQALGYTLVTPKEDLKLSTKEDLKSEIVSLLGGRAAEELIFGSVSNGAADDLNKVNIIVQKMICEWGMGEKTGIFTVTKRSSSDMMPSDYNQKNIESDINQVLTESYQLAKDIVALNIDWINEKDKLLRKSISLEHDDLFNDKDGIQVLKP